MVVAPPAMATLPEPAAERLQPLVQAGAVPIKGDSNVSSHDAQGHAPFGQCRGW